MSFSATCPGIEDLCVGAGQSPEDLRGDSADSNMDCVRERALKEVGLTSTAFIGPAFRSETTVKCDIEDKLSEFYKELEKIDTPIQPPTPSKTSSRKETQTVSHEKTGNTSQPSETDGYQKSSGQKQPPWPHWYKNEPYYNRRPRPGLQLSSGRDAPTQGPWYYTQPLNRPPFLHPPPSFAFPLPHINPNWSRLGMSNHQEELHFPTFPSFPPWNVCSHPSQDFSQPPDNTHVYNSSLVLILMRGLPGSGKSTLARELLSTGPSGLILSTDDYFVHKDGYCFEPGLLGAAHEWNQSRGFGERL